MTLALAGPGRYRIAANWSPYWSSSAGCLSQRPDGTVRLTTAHGGVVTLDFLLNARGALAALEGNSERRCAH